MSFVSDKVCQQVFDDLKEYLTEPLVLMAPALGQPFLIYVRAMDNALGTLLAQYNEHGPEQALYYLSRTMIRAEQRYTPIEKECLALVFAILKMRHYLSGQTIHIISRVNSLKILMTKLGSLNGRLAKWVLLLSPYDIHFIPQKAMKRQAIADFLADHPIWSKSKQTLEVNTVSKEQTWQMFFNGAARRFAAGVGL